MTLTVTGKHELADLEKWATDKFSAVKNYDVVVPDLGDPNPYPKEHLGKLVKFVPVKDKDVLTLYWILPYVEKEFKSRPLDYFMHLFGHEGENSLLSYLISEGLALELSAGADHELYSFSTFTVEVTLTKKGLENYESVIEAVFQYAQRLRDAGPQDYIHNECRDLGVMQFEFQNKGNAMSNCISLSSKM